MKILKLACFTFLFIVFAFQTHAQDYEYNLDETYAINKNGTIHLNSDDAEVSITGTDRSDVHLVVSYKLDVDGWEIKSGDKFKMEVEHKNGNLHILEAESEQNRILVGNVQEEYRITIEAPRDVALNIKGDDGSYDISDLNKGIIVNTDDSEININNVKGNEFVFDIDDGSIEMDEGRGKLELHLDDGDFRVRKGNFTDIDAEFDDSEVEVTTTLADDGMYDFEMDDGDLRLNITGGGGEFDIHHEDTDISASNSFEEVSTDDDRSIYRLSGGKARIDIDSDDGDIDLRTL